MHWYFSHCTLLHSALNLNPKDGSPPKKIAEGKSKEQPAAEAIGAVEEKKEDIPAAKPVTEEKVEKITVGTTTDAATYVAADLDKTQ